MLKIRRTKGFTLIELLVVVVIIGILAAIALPNFVGAQKKAKLSSVKANMHTVQLAAESYATDTGGVYGTIADCAPYFPGGASNVGGAAGKYPTNPFSNVANETPGDAGITTTAAISAARDAAPGANSGLAGSTGYSKTTDNLSYAVLGYDDAGKSVAGSGNKQMVLSNN